MALNIRTNIASVNAQRNLSLSSNALSKTYEQLSSGMRINNAADDAAGLAIAEGLKADSKVASVAIRNANDGISLINIADSAIEEMTNILSRLGELAEQSANGVYTNDQRSALALEFNALTSEVERIAHTTQFNGLNMLSGGANVTFQIGFDGSSLSQIGYKGVEVTLAALGLAPTHSSTPTYSIIGNNIEASQSAACLALDAVNAAIDSITRIRGTLGAAESRLETTIENLSNAREAFKAAESRIRDVDVAEAAAELMRLNILQQAGTAVLAQANQQPQLAMQLLG